MRVKVYVVGRFRQFVAEPKFSIELPEGTRVADLIAEIKMPDGPDLWVLLNDARENDRAAPLKDGDTVHFFQPIAGGRESP